MKQGVQAVAGMTLRFGMDLRDERAGGVDIDHVAALGFGRDRLGHAMGRKDHRPVGRTVAEFLDEDGAHLLQPLHDMGVVNDLVAHVDRRTPLAERLFHDVDGPVHACAKAPWGRKEDRKWWKSGIVAQFACLSCVCTAGLRRCV